MSSTFRFVWDGNVLLHETFKKDNSEHTEVTTWVFEGFVPTAKLVNGKAYSIISDHLGTPILAIDSDGMEVWNRQLDIYGRVRKEYKHSSLGDEVFPFVPFLYQGQYYDFETGLCYNRFRYYSPETGAYISQDPIRLAGGNPTLYGYVKDSNWWVDVFGLDEEKLINGIPKNPVTVRRFMSKKEYKDFKKKGFEFKDKDPRGGISTTSTSVKPQNPDYIKKETGALGADYYVDINTEGKKVELKGKTKGGLPDWKIKDDISPEDIKSSGKVCKG